MNYPLKEEPATWNSAAMRFVLAMFAFARDYIESSKPSLKDIRDQYDALEYNFRHQFEKINEFDAHYVHMGGVSLAAALNAGCEINTSTLYSTLCRKQADYGPENIRRFGREGILVRLHDKIARLENLEQTGRRPENESVSDNYLDVVGYCVVGAMWETEEFLLPLTVAETTDERATS